MRLLVSSLVAIAVATSLQAFAQSGKAKSLRQQTASLVVEMNDLTAVNAELNGKVETLEFMLNRSRQQVEAMQEDDRRIAELIEVLESRLESQNERIAMLENQLAGGSPSATARSSNKPSTQRKRPVQVASVELAEIDINDPNLPADMGKLMNEAKSRFSKFDYDGAQIAFRVYLEKFGDSKQAGEARYWLGESFYHIKQYAHAGRVYKELLQSEPDHTRASGALVKLARTMRQLGDTEAACRALGALSQRYPDAETGTLRLASLERARSSCDN